MQRKGVKKKTERSRVRLRGCERAIRKSTFGKWERSLTYRKKKVAEATLRGAPRSGIFDVGMHCSIVIAPPEK